jgi:alkanesulfonate monooxygenase SsuD/methylene tetrahydromethanopterin reductase-like flavin-dependent oxidoreductase (luciferase family)
MIALPDGMGNPPLSGTPTQIAKAILAYEKAGVEHIMFHLLPYKPAAMRKLEQALHLYHQLSDEQRVKKTA